MGSQHCFNMIKAHKHWEKTLFLNWNKNIVLKLELKKPKTHWAPKTKKRRRKQITGSGIYGWVVISWRRRSTLGGITFRACGLGGLVSNHFSVYFFEIKVLQIHSSRVLDEVSPQELKSFEVPTKEHSIVLFSLLKSLNGLSSNGLEFLLHLLKLFVLFHC